MPFSDRCRNRTLVKQDVVIGLQYRGADKSLARPTSRYILFDGENISFDAYLLTYLPTYLLTYLLTYFLTYLLT